MKKILVWVSLVLACGSALSQEALPIGETIVHDPVMIQQNGTYYLFCTGHGISVFSSKDMKTWTKQKPVFDAPPAWGKTVAPDFKDHIWAPDVSFHNGQYYLYYSVSSFAKNTSAIGVATNKTLDPASKDFKWTDHGIVVQSVPNRDLWNAIDPNLVIDEKGTPWLTFGSFWDGLKMVKLTPELTKIANQPEEWYTVARRERSFSLEDANPGDAALEAPFIFKKDNYYYLFLSWDYCCRGENSTYKVVVGRSQSVHGPFLDANGKDLNQGGGTLVIEGNKNWAGVGHNSTYTFNGKDYLVFHAYEIAKKGRPVLTIKEITWENGWPKVAPMN
ncbi:ABC transporter substrate-binding protein [Flavobacterium akiainvivens]|uniref:ABC transporter substrate-binding protein n=1 Tax=Flavobacterium akiainvivens TaxID=1202724 RepID=A0A0M9VHZ3_9FLAO|nr:arabinan endo-1,5-alpha-L-arabinosidase [Flavobacterium akiainvivens]KOS06090.1 ABC transporter substrate-binding protein [Flavobacterium akiainvivens]SFQ54862.1 arabinan endo-1,5-alpha-L-arabinosidase [Flavobacterium akiainvivens]